MSGRVRFRACVYGQELVGAAAFKSVREDTYVRECGTKKILSALCMHTPERE